jgi:3-(3-hydroxy-phenyl)propionate hydroxylase
MTRADEIADVLVVGYGPSGATMANLLGRRGYRVVVIDQAATVYDKPRAITADHEALRIFQEIGVVDEVVAGTTPHPGTDFVGIDGQVIKRFYPAPPPNALGWEPSFMFVQPELEATLRRGVDRLDAVRVLLQHRFVELVQDDDGVTAQLERLEDGAAVTVRSRYLIAADGASSRVRKQLAAPIEDLAFDEWWLVVDAWIRGPVELPPRCVQYCRPSRPGTYIVGPDPLRRWEIKMLPHESPKDFESHDAVWRVLGEFVDTTSLEHCRTAVYRFHALVVQQWREGRVFLMGDAAHQMPPFMGQGLCAGVRDAFNLAWKLDAVMRLGAAPTLLDTYGEERKRHVRTVVGHAKSFGLIIGELDVAAAQARDQRLGEELASGRAETVRQRFIPGLETGLIDRGAQGTPSPDAGDLFVQPHVRQGAAPWQRFDDVLGARWAVVALDAAALRGIDATVSEHLRALDGTVALVHAAGTAAPAAPAGVPVWEERDGLLTDWLRSRGAVALVARPDRYVYGIARDADDLRRLVETLHATLQPQPAAVPA